MRFRFHKFRPDNSAKTQIDPIETTERDFHDAAQNATEEDPLIQGSMSEDPVGDTQKAFITLLFNKYRGSLHRYLTTLLGSNDDAAELVQETYFRLLRHGCMVEVEAQARAYLFQTATNLARDLHRRAMTHRSRDHVPLDDSIEAEGFEPEREVTWNQALATVKESIKELPRRTRQVYLLSRFGNLTYPQIAARLGISTRTVERKMVEAIDHLSARLGDAL
jgi:RNA polymerase sigma factor (sigma-70 family)